VFDGMKVGADTTFLKRLRCCSFIQQLTFAL
jgi:hypothetical protein